MLRQIRRMHIKAIKMRWLTGGVNYSYLVSTEKKDKSWLIDPAEAMEVLEDLNSSEKKSITAIVNTHHHFDHSGGNVAMVAALKLLGVKPIVISGSHLSPICNEIPEHLKTYQLGDSIEVLCIRTPCHTQDSVCYYLWDKDTDERAIFTGDTLFNAGCGRFFEGTGEEMDEALNNRLLSHVGLDNLAKTKVYPGHEYTKGNVEFIRKEIYKSKGDSKAFDELEKFISSHEVTTGHFSLQDEKNYNPFMRLDDPIVRQQVGDRTNSWPASKVMDTLRRMKNNS
ncbi:HBR255Cp [Eremothecium sinecaudum]|uniref:hydroxyacylglutathione hydrolase n=1 Tax=Eremothecium sinecaudum TaxID=45286 RepID=A0A120K1A7_9SACH|nr:HBR255Cp [Eremothecium sinecaudum]AMD19156.1 HBR255Cp [Eremothecium sinecaudum]